MNQLKDLQVWQKAMNLAKEVYNITCSFPDKEKFGLIMQMNRAAVSIPSNIAEGAGRDSKKEFNQYSNIAMGSCYELETQLILAKKFGYLPFDKSDQLLSKIYEVQKMLVGLKKYLRANPLNTNY
jgi:four helix bundle protein